MSRIKFDQVAVASPDPARTIELLRALGADVWSSDQVTAKGVVYGEEATNKADLHFNYQLGSFEFEVLQYKEGRNWLGEQALTHGLLDVGACVISHLGVHVDNLQEAKQKLEELGYSIIQEVETIEHTNPAIAGKRQYRYVIFNTRFALGFDIKLIERIVINNEWAIC